jgi:transposase
MSGSGGLVGENAGMALTYLPVDRTQPFLLPPDMRDWLPQDHLVWFLLDVLERVDTSVLHGRRRLGGVGRRGYDPDMLLALLVYAYCTKQRSSRQIERLCQVDVAYRVICGGLVPDHTTIARFRQGHEEHAAQLFVDVLVVCAEAGLASVGAVAVDGTKIGADASLKANRTREQLEEQVRAMLGEAEATDAEEDRLFGDARGDELPEQLRDPSSRRARLDAALEVIAERERKQAQKRREHADAAAWVAAARAAAARGEGVVGRPPKGVDEVMIAEIGLEKMRARAARRRAKVEARFAARGHKVPGVAAGDGRGVAKARAQLEAAERAAAQRDSEPETNNNNNNGDAGSDDRPPVANVTDPDSRIMKTQKSWVQGFNAQAAVNEHQISLAGDVVTDGNDVEQARPMMEKTGANLATVKDKLDKLNAKRKAAGVKPKAEGFSDTIAMMLFDAGYWSQDNATADGPPRLIATTKDHKRRKQLREQGTVTGDPPADATAKEAMEHRLCTKEGTELYAKRGTTVEPVFGQHKHNRGYRSFMRRGLDAVKAEWLLILTTGNLLKVYNHKQAQAEAS